jgi:RNA recognition motif-containing protein
VDKVSNRNYAFVHYRTHEAAESALKAAKNLFIGQNKVKERNVECAGKLLPSDSSKRLP